MPEHRRRDTAYETSGLANDGIGPVSLLQQASIELSALLGALELQEPSEGDRRAQEMSPEAIDAPQSLHVAKVEEASTVLLDGAFKAGN